MAKNSFILGLLGIIMIIISGILGIYSTVVTLFAGAISWFGGIDLGFIVGLGVVGLIITLGLFFVGLKFVLDNENKLIKTLLGILGIIFIIIGVVIGVVSSGTAIFFAIVLAGVGLAFLAYGFNINALKPIVGLVNAYKKFMKGIF